MRNCAIALSALAGVSLAACQAPVEVRGNLPDAERVTQLEPGVHSRNDVASILGTPSTTSSFDDSAWYYIGSKTRQFAFFDPQVLERDVLVIAFDEFDTLASAERLTLEDGESISMVSRETPSEGRDMTIVQQLFGNLGRFSAADALGGGAGGPGPGTGRGQLPAP